MSLMLLNLQSDQVIKLDSDNPLIIGRENVEGCFDKRVSRSHGRLTCTVDGKIRLEALHCNPCFFTRNGVPPVQRLNKNEEETLNTGDYFGLLPNTFWFKITRDKERQIKKEEDENDNTRTDASCDDNTGTNVSDENENISASQVVINEDVQCTQIKHTSKPLPVPISNSEITPSCSYKGYGTPEFEKTRRLPLWMYEIDEPISSSSKKHSLSSGMGSIRKKPKVLESESKKEPVEVEGGGSKGEDEITVINIKSNSVVENVDNSSTPVSESHTEPQSIAQAQGESSKENKKKEGYESDVKDGGSVVRAVCQYEGNCYRKNPQHKLEFCHPGDADYVPYEDRPPCEFGVGCYRRNENHKVQFRHPPPGTSSHNLSSSPSCSRGSIASSPLPSKRRRKKVKRGNSDYEDDDEYDLEDPFINDASSDEYVPSDLDSEGVEDLDESREDE